MTKPLYFYNGTTFELVGPTTPQSPIAYQTSAPTGPATGDLWIDSDGDVDTYNRQLTRYYFVATAAQTTITGIDANGLTLAYVAGSEAVYVNGALQVRGQDYTATDGTSVVMTAALAVNDVVEIFAYTAFTVANAYTKSETDGLLASAPGLKLLTPTSISVGSGSGSVGTNGSVTFSGCSSVSLNNVFSSTYDSYKIILDLTAVSGDLVLYMRMRASATDNSGTAYSLGYNYRSRAGSSSGYNNNDATFWGILQGSGNELGHNYLANIDITSPALAQRTLFGANGYTAQGSDDVMYGFSGGGMHAVESAYDGFSLITSTGTVTGRVSVYGYKD